MKAFAERLELAVRHVEDGKVFVERQKKLVRQRTTFGWDAAESQATLEAFERILSSFEDDLAVPKRRMPPSN